MLLPIWSSENFNQCLWPKSRGIQWRHHGISQSDLTKIYISLIPARHPTTACAPDVNEEVAATSPRQIRKFGRYAPMNHKHGHAPIQNG